MKKTVMAVSMTLILNLSIGALNAVADESAPSAPISPEVCKVLIKAGKDRYDSARIKEWNDLPGAGFYSLWLFGLKHRVDQLKLVSKLMTDQERELFKAYAQGYGSIETIREIAQRVLGRASAMTGDNDVLFASFNVKENPRKITFFASPRQSSYDVAFTPSDPKTEEKTIWAEAGRALAASASSQLTDGSSTVYWTDRQYLLEHEHVPQSCFADSVKPPTAASVSGAASSGKTDTTAPMSGTTAPITAGQPVP